MSNASNLNEYTKEKEKEKEKNAKAKTSQRSACIMP